MDAVENSFRRHQRHPANGSPFYRLSSAWAPWGDYGQILLNGGYGRSEDEDALWGLHRPGPFIPPIFFAGGLIFTDSARKQFLNAGFKGVSFSRMPVVKAMLIPWHTWDLEADEPVFYPSDRNAIGYLEDLPHDQNLADTYESFWKLEYKVGARERRVKIDPKSWDDRIYLLSSTWNGADFFRADTTTFLYISSKAFEWLKSHYEAWFHAEPTLTE
jgi:hypothetical protein